MIPDDDFMDDCVSLTYNVEFGEFHERDKYTWVESLALNKVSEDDEMIFRKNKYMDFEFKMNHIKQIIKLEITANFKTKQSGVV